MMALLVPPGGEPCGRAACQVSGNEHQSKHSQMVGSKLHGRFAVNISRFPNDALRERESSGLFGGPPTKYDFKLILLNSSLGISALIEILLFSAIAHHAGMFNSRLPLRALRGWFLSHVDTPCRSENSWVIRAQD
jgi:hypothetical protein